MNTFYYSLNNVTASLYLKLVNWQLHTFFVHKPATENCSQS